MSDDPRSALLLPPPSPGLAEGLHSEERELQNPGDFGRVQESYPRTLWKGATRSEISLLLNSNSFPFNEQSPT